MADPRQIEQELREYIQKEPHLRREDRLKYLMTIFDKHFAINGFDHLINAHDFHEIVSTAKSGFSAMKLPVNLSRKEVDGHDLPKILMIESFVGYLNKNKLLNRLVKF